MITNMKQEDKELLLKDLSARICYSVKCKIALYKTAFNVLGIVEDKVKLDSPVYDEGDDWWEVTEVKPYLRSMSSMTEEEKKKLGEISCEGNIEHKYGIFYRSQDYLNSIHVDYRGLIEKGLALEAPKDMYNIK